MRNLRIREDTAKYLRNLDVKSAYYDPKTRSMRSNPNPDKNPHELDYAGNAFALVIYTNASVNTHSHTHTHTYTHICTHSHTYTNAHMHTYKCRRKLHPVLGRHNQGGAAAAIRIRGIRARTGQHSQKSV